MSDVIGIGKRGAKGPGPGNKKKKRKEKTRLPLSKINLKSSSIAAMQRAKQAWEGRKRTSFVEKPRTLERHPKKRKPKRSLEMVAAVHGLGPKGKTQGLFGRWKKQMGRFQA